METITSTYQKDHEEIDQYLTDFMEKKATDFPSARNSFKSFMSRLRRHITWEEEILFPVFEEKTNMRGTGPTEVMRMEHRKIKDALSKVFKMVHAGNADCDDDVKILIDVLSAHNQKEEMVLYPGLDKLVSEKERSEIYTKMNDVVLGSTRCSCDSDESDGKG